MKTRLINILLLAFSFYLVNCSSNQNDSYNNNTNMSAKEIIEKYSIELLSIDGVVGLYEGLDEKGNTIIKIMTEIENDSLFKKIPKELDGYKVVVEYTGTIEPY